jgi:hypothetical protein
MSAGSTVCNQDPSVIARPGKNTQIIRHTYGRDYSLPDPQFAAATLSYRSDKIAIERLRPSGRWTMPSLASQASTVSASHLIEKATSFYGKSP